MTLALLGSALISAPAFAAQPARPGTVNYVEGAAYLDGSPINPRDIGNIDLEPGQELTTGAGKAEILLTPGVFLRLGSNSVVKMISPDLTLTQIELEKGRAGVEVDELHDQNNLQIVDAGVSTRLQKIGYYEFDANRPTAMVFKGKAAVEVADGKSRELKDHHELLLAGANNQALAAEKPADFNTHSSEDDLYNWSSLRSQYLAEANNQMAGTYGAGYAPGWFWDPYGLEYTYMGYGAFYSPFGWGFYPFGWGGGFYRGYYGRGYVGRGYYGGGFRGGYAGGFGGGFHGGGGRR
jgi:hypothetical protein